MLSIPSSAVVEAKYEFRNLEKPIEDCSHFKEYLSSCISQWNNMQQCTQYIQPHRTLLISNPIYMAATGIPHPIFASEDLAGASHTSKRSQT